MTEPVENVDPKIETQMHRLALPIYHNLQIKEFLVEKKCGKFRSRNRNISLMSSDRTVS